MGCVWFSKAEGETQYRNKAIPVSLIKEKTFKATVPLEFPENTVPDSENVEVSAIGKGTKAKHAVSCDFRCF